MFAAHRLIPAGSAVALIALVACGDPRTDRVEETANGEVAASVRQVPAAFRLVVQQPGNEVRYRVRERLVGNELDNDAVGVTQAVTGEIAFNDDGTVIPAGSRITIDVTGLKSDSGRRDGYVQRRLLETAKFPTVVFEPTAVRGAPKTLPTSGSTAFSLIGNLTVKGVTKPATWFVSAKFSPTAVTGSASTSFTFAEFGISQPRVPVLLSVSDTIKLEYDFSLAVKR
jgi:polyisoprenoid-binding protein YceI